jgi:hypothetical protein
MIRFVSFVLIAAALGGCKRSEPSSTIVEASEFRLVQGDQVRATLAMRDGGPSFDLLDAHGGAAVQVAVDDHGQPRIALASPDRSKPKAVLEVDDKGTHVLFEAPDGKQSYLFQKDDGTTGVVLGNSGGRHRGEMLLSSNGQIELALFDADGGAAFAVRVDKDGRTEGPESTLK